MIKRISASLLIDSYLVVNAYNFDLHLPVGKLNHTLRRLQELEIDDVVLLNTTHSEDPVSDFKRILGDINTWHISTPLSYGGGIMDVRQAIEIVKLGAERVVISPKLLVDSTVFSEICSYLGDQAVVLHLPLTFDSNNFASTRSTSLPLKSIIDLIPTHWGGEILFTFVANDGGKVPDWRHINAVLEQSVKSKGLILAGGFSSATDIGKGLANDQVSAIAVGNYLHRTELSVTHLKSSIEEKIELRRPK